MSRQERTWWIDSGIVVEKQKHREVIAPAPPALQPDRYIYIYIYIFSPSFSENIDRASRYFESIGCCSNIFLPSIPFPKFSLSYHGGVSKGNFLRVVRFVRFNVGCVKIEQEIEAICTYIYLYMYFWCTFAGGKFSRGNTWLICVESNHGRGKG